MVKKNTEYKGIQKKLVAAVAMVLVASIMVVTSSYAWFTLSTAPEVTGINTSVGSNGNLEIALRTGNINAIGNSEGGKTFPAANNFWGNLVDLSNEMYHLEDITLMPAALTANKASDAVYTFQKNDDGEYVDANGVKIAVTDHSKTYAQMEQADKDLLMANGIQTSYIAPVYNFADSSWIKVPTYGADGRISDWNTMSYMNPYQNGGFPTTVTNAYGVRAIGTTSGLSQAEIDMLNARKAVSGAKGTALNGATTSLNSDAIKVANIAVKNELNQEITAADKTNVENTLKNLQTIVDSLDEAVRASVVALGVSQGMTIDPDSVFGDDGKIPTITVGEGENAKTLLWKLEASPEGADKEAAGYVAPEEAFNYESYKTMLEEAYAAITSMDGKLSRATEKLETAEVSYTGLVGVLAEIVNPEEILVGGKTVGQHDMSSLVSVFTSGTTPVVTITKGLYADIAKFVGNYSTPASMFVSGTFGGMTLNQNFTVQIETQVSAPASGWYLDSAYAWLSGLKAQGGGEAAAVMTDLYAYAIDLAFRTNASNSSLLLQTEAKNRVEGSDATQGAGSYMEFTSGHASFTIQQMASLMENIRVLFIDTDGKNTPILAVAGLDVKYHQEPINNPDKVQYMKVTVTKGQEGEEDTITPVDGADPVDEATFLAAFTAAGATAPSNEVKEQFRVYEQKLWKCELVPVYKLGEDGKETTEIKEYKIEVDRNDTMTLEAFEALFEENVPLKAAAKPVDVAQYLAWEQAKDAEGNALYVDKLGNYTTTAEGNEAVYEIPNYTIVNAEAKTIRASLELYNFEFEGVGTIKTTTKLAKQTITSLTQNVAKGITAMVYLDGNNVGNKDVAIGGNSMNGKLNLQFASDAALDPMDYTFGEKLAKPTAKIENGTLTITPADDKAKEFKISIGGFATKVSADGANPVTALLSSDAFAEVPAGTYKIEIVAAGQGYVDSEKVIVEYTKAATP